MAKQNLKLLQKRFEQNKNPQYASKMKRYMRNKSVFLGIKTEARRKISKDILVGLKNISNQELEDIVNFLWTKNEREYQYFGIDLIKQNKLNFEKESILLLEKSITEKSWWDSVDSLSQIVNFYFKKFPEELKKINKKWIESDNFWLQRITLIFQLSRKEETDLNILFGNIKKLKESEEFFIKKAIGWALREYAKTDPEEVKRFIADNQISGLSKREALKHLKK